MAIDLTTIIGSTTGAVALYGLSIIVRAVIGRRVPNAEAAKILSDSAVKLVNDARNDARIEVENARREVSEARMEAEAARRSATVAERAAVAAERTAEDLAYNMERLIRVIMHPASTLDSIREMVKHNQTRYHINRNGQQLD